MGARRSSRTNWSVRFVRERGLQLAEEIAKNSRIAIQFSKLALNAAHEMSSDVGMLVEATAQAVLFEDEEKQTRMQAFLDRKKRPKKAE